MQNTEENWTTDVPKWSCHAKIIQHTKARYWRHFSLDTIVSLTTFATMPRRKSFTNWEKLHLLSQINERQSSGETLRACCRHFKLQPSQVRWWRNQRADISNSETANCGSVHTGRISEQGFMVSVRLFTLRACELSGALLPKEDTAIERGLRYLTILGFEQDCTSRRHIRMSVSSRTATKRGPWFHRIYKAEDCWAKPSSKLCDQHGSDSHCNNQFTILL